MFSTSGSNHEYIGGGGGGVQYIGGHHEYIRGYHEYIGGCSVHRGDIMSTSGGHHEYIGGCSVHRGVITMHVGARCQKAFQFILKTPIY